MKTTKFGEPCASNPHRFDPCTTEDMGYDANELEFFRAIEKFKAHHHIPFPTLRDTLNIITGLGYRKGPNE